MFTIQQLINRLTTELVSTGVVRIAPDAPLDAPISIRWVIVPKEGEDSADNIFDGLSGILDFASGDNEPQILKVAIQNIVYDYEFDIQLYQVVGNRDDKTTEQDDILLSTLTFTIPENDDEDDEDDVVIDKVIENVWDKSVFEGLRDDYIDLGTDKSKTEYKPGTVIYRIGDKSAKDGGYTITNFNRKVDKLVFSVEGNLNYRGWNKFIDNFVTKGTDTLDDDEFMVQLDLGTDDDGNTQLEGLFFHFAKSSVYNSQVSLPLLKIKFAEPLDLDGITDILTDYDGNTVDPTDVFNQYLFMTDLSYLDDFMGTKTNKYISDGKQPYFRSVEIDLAPIVKDKKVIVAEHTKISDVVIPVDGWDTTGSKVYYSIDKVVLDGVVTNKQLFHVDTDGDITILPAFDRTLHNQAELYISVYDESRNVSEAVITVEFNRAPTAENETVYVSKDINNAELLTTVKAIDPEGDKLYYDYKSSTANLFLLDTSTGDILFYNISGQPLPDVAELRVSVGEFRKSGRNEEAEAVITVHFDSPPVEDIPPLLPEVI